MSFSYIFQYNIPLNGLREEKMQKVSEKRCVIGEGPIWNDKEKRLYYTNGMGGNELCILDIYTGKLEVRPLKIGSAAYAFDKKNRLIVSRPDGKNEYQRQKAISVWVKKPRTQKSFHLPNNQIRQGETISGWKVPLS